MSPAATNRTHLSKAEMVDFAEGGLASARMAHLNACGTCREEAEALRALYSRYAPVPSRVSSGSSAKRAIPHPTEGVARR